jgi:hypothetical protein
MKNRDRSVHWLVVLAACLLSAAIPAGTIALLIREK